MSTSVHIRATCLMVLFALASTSCGSRPAGSDPAAIAAAISSGRWREALTALSGAEERLGSPQWRTLTNDALSTGFLAVWRQAESPEAQFDVLRYCVVIDNPTLDLALYSAVASDQPRRAVLDKARMEFMVDAAVEFHHQDDLESETYSLRERMRRIPGSGGALLHLRPAEQKPLHHAVTQARAKKRAVYRDIEALLDDDRLSFHLADMLYHSPEPLFIPWLTLLAHHRNELAARRAIMALGLLDDIDARAQLVLVAAEPRHDARPLFAAAVLWMTLNTEEKTPGRIPSKATRQGAGTLDLTPPAAATGAPTSTKGNGL